jgi:D-cysteine desulfhydrase
MRARRLEEALASEVECPPIWIKRDDLTGFSLAGNKARKLEFLLTDALHRRSDVLVTGGGPGSNHCQASAAAAAVAGLDCQIVMYGKEPATAPANLRLVRLFGAKVIFTGDPDRASVDGTMDEVAGLLRSEGRRPFVIPRGGATALGAVGYAKAARELAGQLETEGVAPSLVVHATGSCGTQAGLVAGTVELGRPWRLVGMSVSRPVDECRERVLQIAAGCSELLGIPEPAADDVEVRDERGRGYGLASEKGVAAAELLCRTEGLLLDPVFTQKAMAAMLDLVREGSVTGPVVFVHTGGTAALLDEKGDI